MTVTQGFRYKVSCRFAKLLQPINDISARENMSFCTRTCSCVMCFISPFSMMQALAGDATLMFYGTEEGTEGKTAYVERRRPDFTKFPRRP